MEDLERAFPISRPSCGSGVAIEALLWVFLGGWVACYFAAHRGSESPPRYCGSFADRGSLISLAVSPPPVATGTSGAGLFAIEVCGYSVTSNHLHLRAPQSPGQRRAMVR